MKESRSNSERKRVFEFVAMIVTTLLLVAISRLETRLFDLSESLAKNHDFVTTVIYFGTVNLNIILILLLSFLIFRNIAKLVLERRRGVLGSRLRTKLVAMLVFFALAPTTLIFVVSTGFITRSFDQWFSEKVKTTIQQTREAGAMVYKQDQRRLESLARIALHRIVLTPPTEKKPNPKLPIDARRLDGFESEYGLSTVRVFDRDGKLVWSSRRNTGAAAISTASDSFVQSAITRFSSDPGLVSISTVEGEDRQDVVKGVAPLLNSTTQELMGVVLA